MNLDDLVMLNDDQIDYNSLPDSLLRDLAFGNDYFVANSALVTLSQRNSELTSSIASDILDKKLGDRYLQAAAINTLFDWDPQKALNFISKEIKTCDPYLFNTILELMISNFDYFKSIDFSRLVEVASKRLSELKQVGEKWPNSDVSQKFLSLYGNLKHL